MEAIIMAFLLIIAVVGTVIYIVCRTLTHKFALSEIELESACRHAEIDHIFDELNKWTENSVKTAMKPLEDMVNMFNPKEEP